MNDFKWRFPPAHFGQKSGISHAGIEGFAGKRIESLTREIIQNSLDAKDSNRKNFPVIVEFKQFNLSRDDFPDVNGLSDAINKSYLEASKLNDTKPKIFFEKATKVINSELISFLRISDFNTNGLRGVNSNKSSSWNNLVKSQGISDKETADGGSFGIGKNAAFTCSDLRTIIYSTLTIDNEIGTQGVANLISFDIEGTKDYTQGTGYLGKTEENKALLELTSLDYDFKRETPGTDIFIAGLYKNKNIEKEIITATLNNFLYAIYMNDLEIIVNDVKLNKSNLKDIVFEYRESLETTTFELYSLLYEEDVMVSNVNIYGKEEDMEIRILLKDDGSRKISMIRKPWMKIKELDGFPRRYKFLGAAIIKGNNLNALLRKIENPQHDDWEPDRIESDNQLRSTAQNILRKMTKAIRDKLEKLHEIELTDYLDIWGAGDYIPLTDSTSDQMAQMKVEDKVKETKIRKSSTLRHGQPIMEVSEGEVEIEIGGPGDEPIIGEPKPEKDKSITKLEKFEETLKKETVKINKKKEEIKIISKDRHNGWYRLIVKSDKEASYHLKLHVLDEQAKIIKDAISLESVETEDSNGSVFHNYLRNINLKEGLNMIDVKINQTAYVSIGVEIYEIQR